MKRTVTALYETREEADRVGAALQAQHLSDEVEICDAADENAKRHHRGLGGWLSDLFGGHRDHQLYAEGVRRGHFLVTAKVDELNETRAATVMEAAAMNLVDAEKTWRSDGWTPERSRDTAPADAAPRNTSLETSPAEPDRRPYAPAPGSSVRAYTVEATTTP